MLCGLQYAAAITADAGPVALAFQLEVWTHVANPPVPESYPRKPLTLYALQAFWQQHSITQE